MTTLRVRREDIIAISESSKTISSLEQTIKQVLLPMVEKHERMLVGENGDNGLKSDHSKLCQKVESVQSELSEHKINTLSNWKDLKSIFDQTEQSFENKFSEFKAELDCRFKDMGSNSFKHIGIFIALMTPFLSGVITYIVNRLMRG